ncbi:helix-turn-helix domain-containing protein [Veillonella caviae]|uniref:helix-turn-helix domain-containing protein n=1 Tax=Veillonella caviae TaxID=248316 RepID=UPI0023F66AA9|nr:helix-turn-helix domain-containing protein [Veillonella caviae]MCI7693550.1 helix-turn-helix domain-containing protein [Veillonella caviae]MDY5253173.1 helix-turn-helix domain-containing protein [Veillonella caviae]
MVNILKLKGKLIENGMTIKDLAKVINVNESTVYRKFNNNGDTITIKEAELISVALKLNRDEINSIFFVDVVA